MEILGPDWRHTNLLSGDGRRLHRPSLVAVLLECLRGDNLLEQATGFVVQQGHRFALVTNRHVLAGVNPNGRCRNEQGVVPNRLRVHLWARATTSTVQTGVSHEVHLRDDAECQLWTDHPQGWQVDVAAIELQLPDETLLATVDPSIPATHLPGVCDDVFVVGFPFGVNAEGLAVWTRGTIATEYEFDYDELPRYLIDARTRPGQSGSPVFVYLVGAYTDRFGAVVLQNPTSENIPTPGQLPTERHKEAIDEHFVGIYAGRVDERADLGFLWRPQTVADVVGACLGEV